MGYICFRRASVPEQSASRRYICPSQPNPLPVRAMLSEKTTFRSLCLHLRFPVYSQDVTIILSFDTMEKIAPSVLRSVHSKSAVLSFFLSFSKYFSQSPFVLYCLGVFTLLLSFFIPFFILSLVVSLFPVFSVFYFVAENVPTSKALLRHWVKRFSPH